MAALAVIPARGGSRGIPRKNIKLLCGEPLVAWSIMAAQAARRVERVVVSTDDDEIASVSRRYKAEVVMRPPELSGDLAPSEAALLHVLETLQRAEGYRPSTLAFLQCTAPLILPQDIDGTLGLVIEGGYDSAVTMTPFHFFVWRETAAGAMEGVNHEASQRLMRQQRQPEYLEVGAVYAMRTAGLLEHRFRFFGRVGKYLLPASRALEIDDPEDWALAEMLMHSQTQPRSPAGSETGWDKVRAVVSDFDGVMTDNRVVIDQQGGEAVVCNRGDGWGISLLRQAGILVACISTEENPVVRARCEKLGIPYWQAQRDKLAALQAFLDQYGLEPEECLYVGNDTNDAACLQHAGVAVVPRDAASEVQHLAHWQTRAAGGEGVLREIAARLLKERQRDEC